MNQNTEESKVNIETTETINKYENLVNRIANFIDKLNIDTTTIEISLDNCIKIIGEINKGVSEIKDISNTFINISPEDKAEEIYKITVNLLNDPIITNKLSPEVQTQIKNYANNKELVNAIGELVNWVSDAVLTSYDNNNDGVVTVEEISNDVVDCCLCKSNNSNGCACYRQDGCCSCCSKCAKSFGIFWGKFFTNILCCGCGSNKINIK